MRKPVFCICENKDADQLRGNHAAAQRLCFRYMDSTIPLLPTFQASSHPLWLYSLVCVGPVRKPRRQIFSRCGSFVYQCLHCPARLTIHINCHTLVEFCFFLQSRTSSRRCSTTASSSCSSTNGGTSQATNSTEECTQTSVHLPRQTSLV